MRELWFWQRIVSPHMALLAAALVRHGCKVVYVAEREMSEARASQGWRVPDMPGVDLRLAGSVSAMTRLANDAPVAALHLCQGLRGNGLVGSAQRCLWRRGVRTWSIMEAVADSGAAGILKRLVYRALLLRCRHHLAGILAIGASTSAWLVARGMPAQRVFPFAYFLAPPPSSESVMVQQTMPDGRIRILYVGRLEPLKRVDLLLEALAMLDAPLQKRVHLQVVGDGSQGDALRLKARKLLGDRVEWLGGLSMADARLRMREADCLVLPSDYDGWGAVISEALMAGTPVVCSDACGAAAAVAASGAGGVFQAGNRAALARQLANIMEAGGQPDSMREALARWALALAADAGAAYLLAVLQHVEGRGERPAPPWQPRVEACA